MKTKRTPSIACALLLFLCLGAFKARAQMLPQNPAALDINTPNLSIDSVVQYLQLNVSPNDTGEGGSHSQIAEFARTWRHRVTRNDSTTGMGNMFQQYLRASYSAGAARIASNCSGSSNFSGNWTNIGPDSFSTQNLGMFRDVYASPRDTNFLLAACYGGLFRSRDAGRNWTCITDNTPVAKGIVSPVHIAVSPLDSQVIYLGSGTYYFQVSFIEGLRYLGSKIFRYGNALLSTTNGGVSWQQEILPFHTPADLTDSVAEVERVFFSPNGKRVYAFRDSAIFFKMAGGAWQGINPASQVQAPYLWKELEFVPDGAGGLDSTHFFIAAHQQGRLMEVQYSPATQAHSFTNIPLPFGDTAEAVYLSIPTPDMMYVATGHDLWRYRISSQAWSFIASVPLSGADIWDFEASKSNPAIIYFADLFDIAHMSADTGHSTVPICFYYGNPTHGDVRALHIHSTTNTATGIDDRIYCATDGGISMKPAGVNPLVAQWYTLQNINGKGLATGRFMGVGTSEQGGLVLGSQGDNGYDAYEPLQNPKWICMAGHDAEEAEFRRTEPVAYGGGSGGGFTQWIDEISSSGSSGRILDSSVWIADVRESSIHESHSGLIPMWGDPQGGMYTGFTHMWRILPHSRNFVKVSGPLSGQPGAPYDIHLPEYKKPGTQYFPPIKCMSFSHYLDSLTGYVVYEDSALFYRNYYAGANLFGKRSTIGFTNDYPATDIVCDPRQPAHVWLSCGGIYWGDSPRYRVMYSPDAAGHWFDISKGLPAHIPVTHIVAQEGTPFLYCSTDVGIFKADMSGFAVTDSNDKLSAYQSVQWTCFNKGAPGQHDFPMVNVTDLEINYCAGKLYASTYGRAIWSSDILNETAGYNPAVGDMVPQQTEIITANTTWAGDKTLYTGVRIKTGATLTIQNTGSTQTVIHMPKNGAIVVEPGAKLIVDGARITNDCGAFWKGILVEGNPALPQRPNSNQGVAEVKNGAVIEHARVGMGNNGESVEANPLAVSGGIIRADGAYFHNNARGIAFGPYHNKLGRLNLQNESHISRCKFVVDDGYRGQALGYGFLAHMSLSDVDGMYIGADSFLNLRTSPTTRDSGFGINTWNAGIMVVPECGTMTAPCPASDYLHNYFQGFKVAINSNSSGTNYGSYNFIDYADFKDNGIGIYARYGNEVQAFHSRFWLDKNGASFAGTCNCTKGIWLAQLPQYRIEEDSFMGYASGTVPYNRFREGIRIEQGGAAENTIYRNGFSDVEYGGISSGINREKPVSTIYVGKGLQFVCNDFTYNNAGIIALHGDPASVLDGIRRSQGAISSTADNTFSPAYNAAHPSQLVNGCDELWYFRGSSNLNTLVYHNNINLGANVWLVQSNIANTCPARLIRNPVSGYGSYSSSRPSFAAHLNLWQADKAALAQKMDGGSTAGLLAKIDQSTDGLALGDTLFSLAPYLSDDVLRAAAANNKVPVDKMMPVLLACPEMLSEALLEYLGTLLPGPYPEANLDTLRAHRGDRSAMSNDLAAIDSNYRIMALAHQDLMWEILSDTAGSDIDTVAYWRRQLPEFWPRYQNAFAYLGVYRYADAQAELNLIPEAFSLADESLDEYNTYQGVMNLLKGVYQDGRDELSLDSAELDSLLLYAQQEHGAASYLAANLRNQNLGIIPLPCDTNYGSGGAQRITRNGVLFTGSPAQREGLNVQPNPARDEVRFNYDIPGESEPLRLLVSDLNGRRVYAADMPGRRGTVSWNVRAIPAGLYLYKITSGKKQLRTGRLSVLH